MSRVSSPNFRFVGPLAVIVCLSLLTGCADVFTYSRDAQLQGMRLYHDGNYVDAAGAFQNSVRQNPANYESFYYLGNCYEHTQQWQQAIVAYKSALENIKTTLAGRYDDEMHQKILSGLADCIGSADQRNIELDALQKDAQDKGTAENWFILAKIYAKRGDADSAIDAYNRASLLEPTDFYIVKDYGLYLEKVGQSAKSEGPLKRAYSLNHDDPEVASALRRLGVIPGPTMDRDDQSPSNGTAKGPIPVNPPQRTVEAPRD